MLVSGITQNASGVSGFDKTQMGGPPHKPNVDDMVSRMTEDLGLTEEQQAKLKTILEEYSPSEKTENTTETADKFDPETARTNMEAGLEKLNEQIKAILTDEQAEKFQNFIDSRKNEQTTNFQDMLDKLKNQQLLYHAPLFNSGVDTYV